LEGCKVGRLSTVSTIKRFEEIDAWQTAQKLTRYVYELSSKGSLARDCGPRDQMRRSAVSIMSNIAEGFESRTPTMFIEFLGQGLGGRIACPGICCAGRRTHRAYQV